MKSRSNHAGYARPFGIHLAVAFYLLLGFHATEAADWETGAGFRSTPLTFPGLGKPGFTELPATTCGIDFTNQISRTNAALNQILLNGSVLPPVTLTGMDYAISTLVLSTVPTGFIEIWETGTSKTSPLKPGSPVPGNTQRIADLQNPS
jgi:hypothetical protein